MARTVPTQKTRTWREKPARTWTDVLTEVTGEPPTWQETIQKMHQAHIDRILHKVRKGK